MTHYWLLIRVVSQCCLMLDLSAGFNAIDHKVLLDRLENIVKVKVTAFSWFKSYLTDYYQFVENGI